MFKELKRGHFYRGSTGGAKGIKSFPSEGFLLLNFEFPYRNIFALSLRLRGHKVFVPEEHGKTYADLTDDHIRNADYLFCDLTRRISHDEFQALRRICRLRRKDDVISLPKACYVPEEWTREFQQFIGAEFEAHIMPCKTPHPNLLPEAMPSCSGGADEGGTL